MESILDLHIHSVFSIDSPITPEEYLAYLANLQAQYKIDGLAFCEHRRFVWDFDYQALSKKYGLKVFAGLEAETNWGHFLVFSADFHWLAKTDFNQKFHPQNLIDEAEKHHGIAIPAHPFRGIFSVGEKIAQLNNLHAIEVINGANQPIENQKALLLAEKLGLGQTGGSDAHFLAELGAGLTQFQNQINSIEELILEIKSKRTRALGFHTTKL